MATRNKPLFTQADITVPGIHVIETPEEGWAILDRQARARLGMSAPAFIEAWDRGDFAGDPENIAAYEVAMLLSLVR